IIVGGSHGVLLSKNKRSPKAPFANYTVGYRLSSQSVLSLCNNGGKAGLVVNRQVGQNLAVQGDGSLVQASDELAVADAQFTASSVDTGDPQRAEHAFLVAAVTVGVLACLHDCLLGYPEHVAAATTETFGLGNDFFVAGARVYTAFYSGHVEFSIIKRKASWP